MSRRRNKVIAWFMTFVMIFGLMVVPSQSAKAEERTQITVNDATNTSNEVYVVLEKEKDIAANSNTEGNWPTQDIAEYKVHILNNKATDISDWKLTISLTGTPYWGYEYNGASLSGNTITVDTYSGSNESGETWNNMTVEAGEDKNTGAGFALPPSALEGATYTLTYYDGASSGTAGSGSGNGGGTGFDGSNIGTIDTSTNYNFAKLLQLSLYFYDANMCGDQVSETSLYSTEVGGWRGDCHVNDYYTYNGKQYKAVGGFHDAGDHVKFGMPANEAFITLGISYLEFGQAFDELGQKEHFKTLVDYYCTYLKSCTVLDSTGEAAEAFCYQIGCGQKDHESWVAPEVENESATNRTYSLVATSSNPATEYVAGAAAALAINYLNFGNEEDLKYAKALFAMAKNNAKRTGSTDTSGSFYASGSWEDEYCLAAAMLYKITKDSAYATEYNSNNANASNIQKPNGWCNLYQFASYYAPTKNETEWNTINGWLASQANGSTSSYYWGDDSWGTARINCNVQFSALLYDKLNDVDTYATWCRYQMSTILGNNSRKINLVCGYNSASPVKPHHRAASGYAGWTDFNNNATQKYTLYGALVGGPTSSDFSTYKDAVNDAVSNEVTLDYNAGMVGAAAALYLLYKDSTEDGFTEQTVLSDFYGGSGFTSAQMPSGYGGGSNTPVVSVESISVTPATTSDEPVELQIGEKAAATVTITPDDATNKNYTVASDDISVATVTKTTTGFQVEGKATGTAAVTVTASGDTTKKAVYYVKVVASSQVTDFKVNKETVSLNVTDTATLSVTSVEPVDADAYTVNWSVDDETIISLDKTTGDSVEITGLKEGTATVTAKIGTLTKKIKVTVSLAAQTAPTVSYTVVSQTSNQIKVKATTESTGTLELSLDKTTWVQAVDGVYTFDGLEDGADITIYARLAGSTGQAASDVSADTGSTYTVYDPAKLTDEAGNYVIDINKITSADCDYVKKLATKVENGVPTTNIDVEASGDAIVITTKDEKNYVISGTNDKVVLTVTAGSDIILNDTSLNQIVVNGSSTLNLQGTNTVTNGITIANDSKVIIDEVAETTGSVTVTSSTGSAISGAGDLVVNGGSVTAASTATNGDGIHVTNFAANGGSTSVSSSSGNGIVAGKIDFNGENTSIHVESAQSAVSGSEVSVSGAGVSLTVTGPDVSVVEASGSITLNSGSIETVRPSDSNGYDYSIVNPEGENTGAIMIGDGVTISGDPQYSTPPVDSQGNEVSFVNIKVYNGDADITFQCKKNSSCNLLEEIKIKEWMEAQPYKTAVFTVNNQEIKDGKLEVGTENIEVTVNWVAKTYTITYECNGGTFVTSDYKTTYTVDDGSYTLPTNIKRNNYVFLGWFRESSFENEVKTVSVELDQDITVYAKWVIDKPEKPVITSVVNSNTGVTIKWNGVEGVNYYILQRKVSGGSWTEVARIKDSSAISYIDTTVVHGKCYNYRICGYGYSCGEFSDASKTVRYIASPKLLSLTNEANGVTVKWSSVKGVTGYLVYRSSNGGAYQKVANIKGAATTAFYDKKATGKAYRYKYRIYSYKTISSKNYLSGASAVKTIYYLAKPSTPVINVASNGLKLTWTATVGANGYCLYRSTNGSGYKKIATVKGKAYIDKNVSNGKKYQYKIMAYKSVSGVAYKSTVSNGVGTYYMKAPGIVSLTNSGSREMTATWSRNTVASGYQIQYSTTNRFSNATTFTLKKNTILNKKVTGLTKGKTYYVRLRSYKIVGSKKYYSGWSTISDVTIIK